MIGFTAAVLTSIATVTFGVPIYLQSYSSEDHANDKISKLIFEAQLLTIPIVPLSAWMIQRGFKLWH